MSKAVLVMDMPCGCENCVMAKTRYSTDKNYCILTDRNFDGDLQIRPDWCPLKPMPEKKKERYGMNRQTSTGYWETYGEETDSVAVGYNACIDELLNGEEG